MINIVCLKWGAKYGAEYVNRLYSGIIRNTTKKIKFHCFTDDSSGINSNVVIHNLPYTNIKSWWNKLYLFSNNINIPLGEKIFYVDLDTLITSNIDDLLSAPCETIIVLRDFLSGIAQTAGNMGSGLMSWQHGDYEYIWNKFIKNPNAAIKQVEPHGDQHWVDLCVEHKQYWQELFPNKVVSFKVHCQQGLPASASVICYHGVPGIPESVTFRGKVWKFNITPQPWVLKFWKDHED